MGTDGARHGDAGHCCGHGESQTPPSWRPSAYWAYSYKRTWRGSVATSFLIPILYLAAMGIGLGSLVDKHSHTVDGVKYLYFLAPGLLASTAMQIGTNESMYPVMGAIKWIRTYFAMLATPLSVTDVLLGTIIVDRGQVDDRLLDLPLRASRHSG